MCAVVVVAVVWTAATTDRARAAEPVRVRDSGANVVLDNGIVSVEIAKASGNVLGFALHGKPLLAEPAYLDWNTGTDHHIEHGEIRLRVDPSCNGGERAEVVITRKFVAGRTGDDNAYDVSLHHVLRREDSGFYSYAIFDHPKTYPQTGIGQSRMVFRLRDDVFDFIQIDEQRRRPMPPSDTPTETLGPKESLRFTAGPFKGQITDKYHHFVDAGDHFVHGWTGTKSHIGCWQINASNEDHNGGPTAQHNTAHWGRLMFHILTDGHYGGSGVDIPAGAAWQKIYGPWLIYANSGGDNDALWADAKKKAAIERAAWPYAWMNQPSYPPAGDRGAVTGRLHLVDPQDGAVSAARAWVGLAAASPDWQQQSDGYQYWARAAADGSFTIQNVRPGTYTLYAFTGGVMDEFRRDGVRVAAGAARPLELGTLEWPAVHFGQKVWQIGTPDRTAKEFGHGDDFRHWGLWNEYPKDFPDGLNFVIGKSHERTDWNFAQGTVQKDGQWVGTAWNVRFDLPASFATAATSSKQQAVLRIAIAAANNAELHVLVNGTDFARLGKIGQDNALARAGIHGQYHLRDVKFDASLLKPGGENVITLDNRATTSPFRMVMYDCLRLEIPTTPQTP